MIRGEIMKIVYKMSLIFFLLMVSIGCSGESTDETTTDQTVNQTIEGEYEIDITDLGMPLVFYLKIDGEDNFYLSPDRTYATDKGHGTVASSGGTYMFIYSDSTPEESKTTTFEFEEGNLHFQTGLHYGSSNLPASKEDENNPDIIYYLVGKTLAYEDYFGEYAGQHTVTAMGSEVTYDYFIELNPGRTFNFVSEFTMASENYEYLESGYYDIDGDEIILHLEDDITGHFDEDMNLTIGIKASEMGEREERVLQLATTAACSNTYYGYAKEMDGQDLVYETNYELLLDKFGGYVYTANDLVSGEFTETGEFTYDGVNIVFYPATSDASYSGTLTNFILDAPFMVSDGAETRTDIKFYCNTIQGVFVATGEDEAENQYQARLELFNDGTFTLLLEQGETLLIDQSGEFTVRRFMLTQLILTATDSTVYELVISEQGLNVNFDLGDETVVGMILEKE
jgi:hypothetical protein